MKQMLGILFCLFLGACDRFHNDNWQSYFQTIDVGVTGGSTDNSGNNPLGDAFGDNFKYNVYHSAKYWGEDGQSVNTHYKPYSVGSSTQYYRGQMENGNYGTSHSYYK